TADVTFTVTASDFCGTVTNLLSVPASGSAFPIGVTTVTNTATDNSGNTSQCTFTVTVAAGNRPPVANADSYGLNKNSLLTVNAPGVLSNDTDLDGDTLTAVLVGTAAHGSLTLNANGSFTYTPVSNYFGADSFTYRASDGVATSGTATVSLTITTINRPPVATDDSYNLGKNSSLSVTAPGVLANDTDLDGDALSVVAFVATVAHGSLTLHADGSFTYTPASNYFGGDSFSYRASDGVASSGIATVSLTITNVNRAPVATDDSYTLGKNGSLSVTTPGVLSNDTDLDGDALSVVAFVATVADGSLTLHADGSFNYTPASNYVGGGSFSYRTDDVVA